MGKIQYTTPRDFDTLVGLTFDKIEGDVRSEVLTFYTTDGRKFTLEHHQDCCESVSIEDIAGDLQDLVGSPILFADERYSSDELPKDAEYTPESYTWSFYRIGTIKGTVVIRWYGTSNGYYGESANLYEQPVDNVEDVSR